MRLALKLFGPFQASLDGIEVRISSRRSRAMLAMLALAPGGAIARDRLAATLWPDRSEEQARASLRQELSSLRRVLGADNGFLTADTDCIRINSAAILQDFGSDTEGDFLEGLDLRSEPFDDWRRETQQSLSKAPRGDAPRSDAAGTASRPSLAVLPFEEIGVGDADMFADGVVEEITSALSRVRDFHVIARQSAYAVQGQHLDIPETARRLGTDYLVEGSIRRANDRVRISVQLVSGRTGRTFWAQKFDDRLDDLFDLQDRIASQVAGQISPNIRAAEIDRARQRPAQDRTGYELVMSALPHFWKHRKDENARAVALLDQAISHAPDDPLAKALKAWALAQDCVYLWTRDPKSVRQQALDLANRAADGVRDHVLTLVAIGAAISNASNEIGRAASFIEQALEIDPNNAWGWMRKGYVGVFSGEPDEARAAFDKAISLSPLDPYMHNMVIGQGLAEFRRGDLVTAKELITRGMELGPGVQWAYRPLISINMGLGLEDEALAAARAFKAAHPGVTIRQVLESLPPTFTTSFPVYFEGLRKAGIPES